jgi:ribosome-associated toxin RatA of RatAB toxin-antitoxin module
MPASAGMRTVDERVVDAPVDDIFQLAADVERWPEYLPPYRFVRIRERMIATNVVEMSANRPFGRGTVQWPTWWVSLMELRHAEGGRYPTIRFRHIEGITKRMEVEWSFVPLAERRSTRVTVLHLWNGPSWPGIGRIAARMVIGPVFVHGIASRTLDGLARAAERRQTSRPKRAITSES